ncbi:hypothetical protein KP509_38G018400 [Ceratopteris richardii]|uniref:Uncharacterized protein n=1 Tax=Ceratopteris richardii TaxID=49495 RepID=A0A8T2Q2S0_CERRI|nr:hypothetical protein KP509_38G018400 [Ceratopteris richardii]
MREAWDRADKSLITRSCGATTFLLENVISLDDLDSLVSFKNGSEGPRKPQIELPRSVEERTCGHPPKREPA